MIANSIAELVYGDNARSIDGDLFALAMQRLNMTEVELRAWLAQLPDDYE